MPRLNSVWCEVKLKAKQYQREKSSKAARKSKQIPLDTFNFNFNFNFKINFFLGNFSSVIMAKRKIKGQSTANVKKRSFEHETRGRPPKRLKEEPSLISKPDSSESDSDDSLQAVLATVASTPMKNVTHITSNGVKDESLSVFEPEMSSNSTKHESFAEFLRKFNFSFDEDEADKPSISRMSISTLNETKIIDPNNSMENISHENESISDMSSKGIRIIYVPMKNIEIVLMPYPTSLTLHGYLKVTVLMGSISIFGYTIGKNEETKVFSSESNMLLKASTLKSPVLTSTTNVHKKLLRFVSKEQREDLEGFLEEVGPGTVIVKFERIPLPPALRFLESYYPSAVETQRGLRLRNTNIKSSTENEHLCSIQETNSFNISPDYGQLAQELKEDFLIPVSEGGSGASIVVYGNKRSGKSSLLRYLVNSALNVLREVYYLDIDPGQTEFTPPGVVSLVKITDPLLSPPYFHQRTPLKMIFTGSITPSTSPHMYIKSVENLIDTFKAKFPDAILFVNTMGWIKGIGGICFERVMKALGPTVQIELVESSVLPAMTKERLPCGTTLFKIPTPEYSNPSTFSALELRNFALLAYFGKCQKFYKEPSLLHEFRPYKVCWDDLAFYAGERSVPPHRLIEAVHSSVVALCHVKPSFMQASNILEYPKTLYDDPYNICLGYGIVRGTNEAERLLYIITPLKIDEMKAVNAIMKGNIILPSEGYLKQEMLDQNLPYSDASNPTSIRQTVRKRARRSIVPQKR